MGKDEAGLPTLVGDQQPSPLGLIQRIEQIFLFLLGKRCQEIKGERPPDAGGGRQDALRGFADAVDAAPEHESDRLGHLDLANLDLRKPFARRIRQTMLLGQMPIDLLDEEGHAFGL